MAHEDAAILFSCGATMLESVTKILESREFVTFISLKSGMSLEVAVDGHGPSFLKLSEVVSRLTSRCIHYYCYCRSLVEELHCSVPVAANPVDFKPLHYHFNFASQQFNEQQSAHH